MFITLLLSLHCINPVIQAAETKPDVKKPNVIVRLVSVNERFRETEALITIVRVNLSGDFFTQRGYGIDVSQIQGIFTIIPAKENKPKQAFLILDIISPKEMSIKVLVEALEKLKRIAPMSCRTVIYVRYHDALLK